MVKQKPTGSVSLPVAGIGIFIPFAMAITFAGGESDTFVHCAPLGGQNLSIASLHRNPARAH
jgi:hypothetical protein